MSRLVIESSTPSEATTQALAEAAARRLSTLSAHKCPVDFTAALMRLYLADSCGKCTPCRVGLADAVKHLDHILEGEGMQEDLDILKRTARVMYDASDCAIGFIAGQELTHALEGFAEDFASHIRQGVCSHRQVPQAPCVTACPAHVDIPGYIACVRAGRLDDALRVIRNTNPLPTVCGYVCEHPCELRCRRILEDAAVNICGLKRYAADNALWSAAPTPLASTGKSVGIIGGGPAGLTAAYYLRLMGHAVTIYDRREKLGGMVRYGIPDYRLPQDKLDADVNFITDTGIQVKTDCSVGDDISVDTLTATHDALFLAIGAHAAKSLGLEGENAEGVMSAVEFLRACGRGEAPDFTGKRVCIVGGGNVAMDCTRTAKRLGAAFVECVYRRRIVDMTALAEEIDEAKAEGCQLTQLEAPVAIEVDSQNHVTGLVTQPQIIGAIGRGGRPAPYAADSPQRVIACDVVIVAIGQAIDSEAFSSVVKTERGCIVACEDALVDGAPWPLYAGGDAVSGPATVIKAIAAGKVAAANIDEALGFSHDVFDPVDIPAAGAPLGPCGRVELKDMIFAESAQTFELAKLGMSSQEATQESGRCLRCDHYGYAAVASEEVATW